MRADKKLISVIIPAYNEEKNIEETIFSVKNQKTNLDYEIIVCDGGSTDKTVEIAQKYVKVLKSPKKGKVTQMNYAAKRSTGKILIFLDADTTLPDNYFEIVYRNFLEDRNLVACSVPHIYKSKQIIAAGSLFFSLLLFFVSPIIWAVISVCQLMLYLFMWDKKFLPITKYISLSQIVFLYYLARSLLNFIEFSGSNICVKRKIFETIGGFKPVPNSKGVDAIFSSALRKYCSYNGGHIKMLNKFAVMTDPRFITRKRIVKRFVQHKKIAKYYEKLNNSQILKNNHMKSRSLS
ncbi:MAG: glycosyltransferase [Candidatus Helarchaeota archaeon]